MKWSAAYSDEVAHHIKCSEGVNSDEVAHHIKCSEGVHSDEVAHHSSLRNLKAGVYNFRVQICLANQRGTMAPDIWRYTPNGTCIMSLL
jgi:hypothetical protein